jgi:hypothetical protein
MDSIHVKQAREYEMRLRTTLTLAIFFTCLLADIGAVAAPDPTPDSAATVVHLRSNCDVNGIPMENCFESMTALSDLAAGWIWQVRAPSASSPLLVDVGPGTFEAFECNGGGYVTVRGSGREASILHNGDASNTLTGGAEIQNCDALGFIDIGISGPQSGVRWTGRGNASWSNVDIFSTGTGGILYPWWDACDSSFPEKSVHYFFGSRVRAQSTNSDGYVWVYATSCAESWFYGGEVLLSIDDPANPADPGPNTARVLDISRGAVFQAFGTTIRARYNSAGGNLLGGLVGAKVDDYASQFPAAPAHIKGATFHAHGSIVSVAVADGANPGIDAIGIAVQSNGSAHTPGSAFVVKGGSSAQSYRIKDQGGGGTVSSPFQWRSGPTPPQSTTESNVVESQDGSDVWVETDCSSSGDCDPATNGGAVEPHLMIYSTSQCPSANPWFDVVTGACRQ